jgi:hypothetical protein
MKGLTNRSSQPLAAAKSTFDFTNQLSMFATLAAASDGSAPSREAYFTFNSMTISSLVTLLAAEAQNENIVGTLVGLLPILLFIGIVYFLFRRQAPAAKLLREERERHIQHMQKMEELAERIAKALERNQ